MEHIIQKNRASKKLFQLSKSNDKIVRAIKLVRNVLIIIFAIGIVPIFYFLHLYISKRSLPGKILMINPFNVYDIKYSGCIVYAPRSGTYRQLLKGNDIYSASFSKNKNKILFIGRYLKSGECLQQLKEYEVSTKKISSYETFNYRSDQNYCFESLRYVPLCDYVSYLRSGVSGANTNLYLFNLKLRKEILLLNNVEGYTWKNDGKTFIFSASSGANEDYVCSYNINTKKVEKLFKGNYPQYSNDNIYLKYIKDNYTIVRNEKNGQEWKIQSDSENAVFSPNDKYVIFAVGGSWVSPWARDIKVWDFECNRIFTLFKNNTGLNDIDWR